MDSKKVYILGAGSSISHSDGLFPSIDDFFASGKNLGIISQQDYSLIIEYIETVFGKSIRTSDIKLNIEDVYTHIEIEIERNIMSTKLRHIRNQLLNIIKSVLIKCEENHGDKNGDCDLLLSRLRPSDTVITFNWDLLLDNILNRKRILKDRMREKEDRDIREGHYWNFIFELSGFGEQTIDGIGLREPYNEWNRGKGYYLKLHGSIDWFYCFNEDCRAYYKVYPLPDLRKEYRCSECYESLDSLIIPPVLNKVYRKYPLIRRIWNVAANEISTAEELVIWGYSLPPTDFYATWLLRNSRKEILKKLILINPEAYNSRSKIGSEFIKRFSDVFLNKLTLEDVFPYESFKGYLHENNEGNEMLKKMAI